MQKNFNCDCYSSKLCASPNRFSQYPNCSTNVKKSLVLSKLCSNFKNEYNKKLACQALLMSRIKRFCEEANTSEYPRCLTNISGELKKDTEPPKNYEKTQNMPLVCPSHHETMDSQYESCLEDFKKMKDAKIIERLKKCYLIMKMKDDIENLILEILPSSYLERRLSLRRNSRIEQTSNNMKQDSIAKAGSQTQEDLGSGVVQKYRKNSEENIEMLANCLMKKDFLKNKNKMSRKEWSSEECELSYHGVVEIFINMWQCITEVLFNIMTTLVNFYRNEDKPYEKTNKRLKENCHSRRTDKIYSEDTHDNTDRTDQEKTCKILKLKKEKCILEKELEEEKTVNKRLVHEILSHLNKNGENTDSGNLDETAQTKKTSKHPSTLKQANRLVRNLKNDGSPPDELPQNDDPDNTSPIGEDSNINSIVLKQDGSIGSKQDVDKTSSGSIYRKQLASLKKEIRQNGSSDYRSFMKSSSSGKKKTKDEDIIQVVETKLSEPSITPVTKVNLTKAVNDLPFNDLFFKKHNTTKDNRTLTTDSHIKNKHKHRLTRNEKKEKSDLINKEDQEIINETDKNNISTREVSSTNSQLSAGNTGPDDE